MGKFRSPGQLYINPYIRIRKYSSFNFGCSERRNSSGRRASVGSTNKNMAYSMSSAEWRNELGIARSYPIWNNTGYAPAYQKPYHLNVDFRFADFDLRNNPQVSSCHAMLNPFCKRSGKIAHQ